MELRNEDEEEKWKERGSQQKREMKDSNSSIRPTATYLDLDVSNTNQSVLATAATWRGFPWHQSAEISGM